MSTQLAQVHYLYTPSLVDMSDLYYKRNLRCVPEIREKLPSLTWQSWSSHMLTVGIKPWM